MNTRTRCEQLAGEGKTQKEIAAIVGVSWSAVRCHLNEDRRHSQNEKIAEHRKRIKRKAVDYSGGKCVKCGYDLCVAAIGFSPSRSKCERGTDIVWLYSQLVYDKRRG